MAETLGASIRSLRDSRGLTLREIEERTGLSSGYVSLLENGKVRQPKPPVLLKLAQALDASYTDFMRLAGYALGDGELDHAGGERPLLAFKGAEKLTDEQRLEVQEFIDFKLRRLRRSPRGSSE